MDDESLGLVGQRFILFQPYAVDVLWATKRWKKKKQKSRNGNSAIIQKEKEEFLLFFSFEYNLHLNKFLVGVSFFYFIFLSRWWKFNFSISNWCFESWLWRMDGVGLKKKKNSFFHRTLRKKEDGKGERKTITRKRSTKPLSGIFHTTTERERERRRDGVIRLFHFNRAK